MENWQTTQSARGRFKGYFADVKISLESATYNAHGISQSKLPPRCFVEVKQAGFKSYMEIQMTQHNQNNNIGLDCLISRLTTKQK